MISQLHLKLLFWLGVGTWVAVLFLNGTNLTPDLMKPSSLALTVVLGAVTVLEKWAWKLRLLHPWFVSTPNLIGTYKGCLDSAWINPATKERHGKVDAYLVVRQTLSTVTIRLITGDSESVTVLAGFREVDGINELLLTYRNEPKLLLRERSQIHYGGARLSVVGKSSECLSGCYWTDRGSLGELEFKRISRETCKSFPECEELPSTD